MIPGADPAAAAALQQQQMMAMYQQMLLQAMANQVPGMQVPGAAAAAAAQPAAQPVAAAPAVPAEPGKRTGYIKNWNEEKKYGFVSEDGTGEDHFCHRSCLVGEVDEMKKGDLVRFDVEMDNSKGRNRAVNVSKTGEGGGPPPKGQGKSSKGEGKSSKGSKSQEAQALQGLDQAAKEELMKQRKEHMVEMNKMKEELLGQGGKGGKSWGKAPQDDGEQKINLYLTGLPGQWGDWEVSNFFGQYGTVYSTKVLPSNGKMPTLAGFCLMDEDGGTFCITTLTGYLPEGSDVPLNVAEAKDKGWGKSFGDKGEKGDKGKGKGWGKEKGDWGGDWNCPACGESNFRRNAECRKCGAPNPDGGGDKGKDGGKGGGKDGGKDGWGKAGKGDDSFGKGDGKGYGAPY